MTRMYSKNIKKVIEQRMDKFYLKEDLTILDVYSMVSDDIKNPKKRPGIVFDVIGY